RIVVWRGWAGREFSPIFRHPENRPEDLEFSQKSLRGADAVDPKRRRPLEAEFLQVALDLLCRATRLLTHFDLELRYHHPQLLVGQALLHLRERVRRWKNALPQAPNLREEAALALTLLLGRGNLRKGYGLGKVAGDVEALIQLVKDEVRE